MEDPKSIEAIIDELLAAIPLLEACITPEDLQELRSLTLEKIAEDLPRGLTEEQASDAQVSEVITSKSEDADIRTLISKMNAPQKIKVALFGNSTARMLLLRDSNKLVQLSVLKNPKLGLKEVEDVVKNPNSAEVVLRTIGHSPFWSKEYSVKLGLVTNPKTPPDVSMKWLRFLSITDLRKIAKSKNVPNVISLMAKKRLAEEQS